MTDIKPTPPDPLAQLLRLALKQQCVPYEESAQYLAIDDHIDLPLLAIAFRGALIGAGKGEVLKAMELTIALESARQEIVLAISFLGRDVGTERMATTVPQLIERLVKADERIRAVYEPKVLRPFGDRGVQTEVDAHLGGIGPVASEISKPTE